PWPVQDAEAEGCCARAGGDRRGGEGEGQRTCRTDPGGGGCGRRLGRRAAPGPTALAAGLLAARLALGGRLLRRSVTSGTLKGLGIESLLLRHGGSLLSRRRSRWRAVGAAAVASCRGG